MLGDSISEGVDWNELMDKRQHSHYLVF